MALCFALRCPYRASQRSSLRMSEKTETTSDIAPLILLIEDDVQIRRFLRAALTTHGYKVAEVNTANDGLRQIAVQKPDLVILDLGLPDLDGLEVTRQLREWSSTPIVVVSAREGERDKVAALDAGADDYLTKPFGTEELLARIRVALRHAAHLSPDTDEPVFSVGSLKVDMAHRNVFVDDTKVHLSPIEYKLLTTLI